MACQHRELHLWLDDAKKLWCYAQPTASKHHALEDALDKMKAKEGIERITSVEKESD